MNRTILRTLFATVAAILLSLPALSSSALTTAGKPSLERDLTIGTFNIHHGAGTDDVLDLEDTAQVIAQSGADVVGLQEVDRHWSARSDNLDEPAWLAERLDMHVVYGANLDLDPVEAGDPRRQYGTAILSKYPIVSSENTLLPRPENGEQRGLLEAEIVIRGVKIRVLNTHLQHNSQVERLAQAQAITEVLDESDMPTFLTGDLNATPETPEITMLTDRLTDAWTVAGIGDGFTYSAEAPTKRIDFVLASGDVTANTAEVVTTDASDHLPVFVDAVVEGVPGS